MRVFSNKQTVWPNEMAPSAIFVSPHLDDVCLSLGATAASSGRGLLLNVFSRSCHYKNTRLRCSDVERISEIRRLEDESFAAAAGLSRFDLGFPEPALCGITPFSRLRQSRTDLINDALVKALLSFSTGRERWRKPILYVPLGIGPHIDHRAVSTVFLNAINRLRQIFAMRFYEEIPYRMHSRRTTLARTRLRLATKHVRVRYQEHPLSQVQIKKKAGLIAMYASQFVSRSAALTALQRAPSLRISVEAWWEIL